MDIHCVNNWLFHHWGPDGKCIRRCGATLYSDRGNLHASTSEDVQSPSAVHGPTRPVGLAAQHGSHLHQRLPEDDSSSFDVAGNLAGSEVL